MSTYGTGTYGAATGTYGSLGDLAPATDRVIAVSSSRPGRTTASRRPLLVGASSRPVMSTSSREPED